MPHVFVISAVTGNFCYLAVGGVLCVSSVLLLGTFVLQLWDSACSFVKKETLPQMFSSKLCEVLKNTLRLLQSINSNARSSYIQISPSSCKIQLLHHQDSEKSVKYQVLFFKQQYLSCDCQYHYCTYFPHKTSGNIQSLFVIHEVLIYQVLIFITQTSYYQLQKYHAQHG